VPSVLAAFRDLASRGRELVQQLRGYPGDASGDAETVDLVRRAREAHAGGRREEEAAFFHEAGRMELAHGRPAGALAHFRAALRVDRDFLPALVALGDAYDAAGEHREAVRTWERAAETHAALPLLGRLERAYREEGRPSRMIAVYQDAIARSADDLALAVALGRVYLELEMLDEAADQFEKVEVRAPHLALVHAYLGVVFERRGESASAFEEYRHALRLGDAFQWPHACTACGAAAAGWRERCEGCQRWNTVRPTRG
jgi:lipopolysaccharide biosynthesis regulator YciM